MCIFFSLYFTNNALIFSYFIRESKTFFIENITHKTKASIILLCNVFHIFKLIITKQKTTWNISFRYSSRTTDVRYTKTRLYNKKWFSYRILRSFLFFICKNVFEKHTFIINLYLLFFTFQSRRQHRLLV